MPTLKAFSGIRYSSSSDLGELVCPPYDVISPDEQRSLHERHPNNAVRLELAVSEPGEQKYRKAGETYRHWLEEGILSREDRPALYVYRQVFKAPDGTARRVMGVMGALELEPFGEGSGVLPHERTMPGPKEDRLALMTALPVNVSPILAIHHGGGKLRSFFNEVEQRPAQARFSDDAGIEQTLWVVKDDAEVALLEGSLDDQPLVIADGHHRYETALAYHQANLGRPGDHGSMLCLCVDADAEGLLVLPYNRVLKTPVEPGDLAARLRDAFGSEPVEGDLEAALDDPGCDHPFVFVTAAAVGQVCLTNDTVDAALGEHHPAWRSLDVVALHEVLLPRLFPEGIDDMSFSKDAAEVMRMVGEGWTAGVILRALRAAQVVDVALSGERMPQKASYFWPKPITGLVFHSLE